MKKCNHIIGFCSLIDDLIYNNDCIGRKEKSLAKDCYSEQSDIIFNYCPLCGKKLDVKI